MLENFRKLTAPQKQAVKLRYEGRKHAEISDETGIPVSTVQKMFQPEVGTHVKELEELSNLGTMSFERHLIKSQEKIAEHMPRILESVVALALGKKRDGKRPPPSVQLNAADSLMDRLGLSRVSTKKTEATHEIRGETKVIREQIYANVQELLTRNKPKELTSHSDNVDE